MDLQEHAFAVPATLAMTESATRADRTVFMIILLLLS